MATRRDSDFRRHTMEGRAARRLEGVFVEAVLIRGLTKPRTRVVYSGARACWVAKGNGCGAADVAPHYALEIPAHFTLGRQLSRCPSWPSP